MAKADRLAELADVHGTVLLGMHKELSDLKTNGAKRLDDAVSALESKLREATRLVDSADTTLASAQARIEQDLQRVRHVAEILERELEGWKTLVASHDSEIAARIQRVDSSLRATEDRLTSIALRQLQATAKHDAQLRARNAELDRRMERHDAEVLRHRAGIRRLAIACTVMAAATLAWLAWSQWMR